MSMNPRIRRMVLAFLLPAVVAGLAACGSGRNEYAASPPPEVTVARPLVQDVIDHHEFTGQVAAVDSVEIRARVPGYLKEIHFKDGDLVEEGELLFTIDPREYDAAVQQAEAEVLNARSGLDFAENDLKRREMAFKDNAVSELDVLRSRAERDKGKAALAGARALLEKANLDLSYTQVRSPVGGRVSRHLVSIGNLVGSGEPTLLTTVRSLDPVYFYFVLDERLLTRLVRRLREKGGFDAEGKPKEPPKITLALAGEETFGHRGVVDYMDNRVNPDTGTIQMRARVENPDFLITAGVFARGKIPGEVLEDSLLVPERVLGVDQAGRFVMVVNDQNVVEQRTVQLGPQIGTMRVISRGLSTSDRIVVNGLMRARPGVEVSPEMTDLAAADQAQK